MGNSFMIKLQILILHFFSLLGHVHIGFRDSNLNNDKFASGKIDFI